MANRMLPSLSLVGVLAALAAASSCSQDKAPPKAKLRECANDPGELRDTPDCVNVKAAAQQYSVGSRKKMEPLRFPTSEEMNASTKRDAPK
jgi:hypothetical protein